MPRLQGFRQHFYPGVLAPACCAPGVVYTLPTSCDNLVSFCLLLGTCDPYTSLLFATGIILASTVDDCAGADHFGCMKVAVVHPETVTLQYVRRMRGGGDLAIIEDHGVGCPGCVLLCYGTCACTRRQHVDWCVAGQCLPKPYLAMGCACAALSRCSAALFWSPQIHALDCHSLLSLHCCCQPCAGDACMRARLAA